MKYAYKNRNNPLYINNIEKKKNNDLVGDIELNVAVEILKFLIFLLISVAFILLQYQTPFDQNNSSIVILRKIYLFSFGLAFGDLMVLIIIGFAFTFILKWLKIALKNYYFKWFRPYNKVDYFILHKQILLFVWTTLLIIALIYHAILVSWRMPNSWIYKASELKLIYTNGWITTFTKNNQPNAAYTVGIFFDSIINVFYVLAFSPYLAYLIIIGLIFWNILKIWTINPFVYIKKLNSRKLKLEQIESYLKKTKSIFYYTEATKNYFNKLKIECQQHKIEYNKLSLAQCIKQLKQVYKQLAQNNSKTEEKVKKQKIKQSALNKEILALINEINTQNQDKLALLPQDSQIIKEETSKIPCSNEVEIDSSETNEIDNSNPTQNTLVLEGDKTNIVNETNSKPNTQFIIPENFDDLLVTTEVEVEAKSENHLKNNSNKSAIEFLNVVQLEETNEIDIESQKTPDTNDNEKQKDEFGFKSPIL
ncbi:hypothetical protein [Mycoplasmopsis iners]|uniref:hypothetical protein n=1 Tax=Mycoplasmopsis iners TaxID=76630 RepID=UPI0004968DC7|nr:hypothetical protein [Mycoplasmopsis iners]